MSVTVEWTNQPALAALTPAPPSFAQELAQVKTPRNVHMKTTSPSQLAWLLAGIVYPEDADEQPDVYVSDYTEAVTGNLNPQQQKTRKSRALAAKFIQKLLAKVRWERQSRDRPSPLFYSGNTWVLMGK